MLLYNSPYILRSTQIQAIYYSLRQTTNVGEDGNFASKYFYQKKAWAVINVVRNRNEHFLQRIGQNNFGEVKRNNFSQIDISAKL